MGSEMCIRDRFKEIAAEQARFEELGIVIDPMAVPSEEKDDKGDDVEDEE